MIAKMDHQQCPLCLTKGKTALLQWQPLDFERKILLCLSSEVSIRWHNAAAT